MVGGVCVVYKKERPALQGQCRRRGDGMESSKGGHARERRALHKKGGVKRTMVSPGVWQLGRVVRRKGRVGRKEEGNDETDAGWVVWMELRDI